LSTYTWGTSNSYDDGRGFKRCTIDERHMQLLLTNVEIASCCAFGSACALECIGL
jgi:hypothetical protein